MIGLIDLPDEVKIMIAAYLGVKDLTDLAKVCQALNTLSNDNRLWQRLFFLLETSLTSQMTVAYHYFLKPKQSTNSYKTSYVKLQGFIKDQQEHYKVITKYQDDHFFVFWKSRPSDY